MSVAPASYRRIVDAYRRGNHSMILAGADRVAVELEGDAEHKGYVPATVLIHGSVIAGAGEPARAINYLEQGLAMLPGTASERELGRGDPFALRLIELQIVIGRYAAAEARIAQLEEPDRPHETRFGAIRARAMLCTARGEYESAHQLLNAAASLTDRMRNPFAAGLVDADRAALLTLSGRVAEGVLQTDSYLAKSAKATAGQHGQWAAATAAATALSVCRVTAETGDPVTAERLLLAGTEMAGRVQSSYLRAHIDLAASIVWWAQGREHQAEDLCRQARERFIRLGAAPAAAAALLHEGRLAWAQGFLATARPLLLEAHDEFARLGHRREVSQIRVALEAF